MTSTKALVAIAASLGLAACAPRPAFVEIELTGLPENPQAVKLGQIKTLVQDHFKGNAELKFELPGHRFTGQMQVIDESVTTTGRANTASQSQAVAVSGQTVGAGVAATQRQTATTSTTRQASSKGHANAVSDSGLTMSCEYVVNNAQKTGTGTCEVSDGSKYRFYSKPTRLVFVDGTSRPM